MLLSEKLHFRQFTVGAKSLEQREKFRAQIQPLLLSSTIKLESCTLDKPTGTHARRLSKNRSTAIMVKKKELSIDEKLKIQVWTVTGVKTAEIAARLGRGKSTIRRLRAELKELLPGRRHRLAAPFPVVPGPLPMLRMRG
jgi:hypothetical protein